MPHFEHDSALRERFVDAALLSVAAPTLAALGADRVRSTLAAHVDAALARTSDMAFAAGFRQWCSIEGTSDEDYLYALDEADGDVVLSSIRFKGGDRTRPFVQLEASTAPGVPSPAATHAMATRHRRFAPTYVRWFDTRPLPDLDEPLRADLRVVAGTIDTVIGHRPPGYDRLRLVRAVGLDWYDRYVAGYDEYFREYPGLIGELSFETRETLQTMLDRGTLFEAHVDDAWAGVAGTWHDREYLVEGEVIGERMLAPEHRGAGLGAALVWHLARSLEVAGSTLLFGTIAPSNERSLRSAKRVGRVDVGGYVFAPLAQPADGNSL